MSTAIPPRPRQVGTKHQGFESSRHRRRFVIVASQFNAQYVQGLIDHATAELRELAPSAVTTLHQVPGAFEIPIVAREVAVQQKPDAILALGVILQGKTKHAENLGWSVTDALQRIALEHGVPVINAVLVLDSETQARERCLEEEINRGTEAARAAIQVADVLSDLREQQS
ncbi:MAG: 6,7-dimethyl-8-ribityllumazine synthase [Verrucomicrobiota bacterium]|jgi:6,7-dimethyl-8-ribityllumazine synthase